MYMLKSVVSMALFAVYAAAQTAGTLQFTNSQFPTSIQAGDKITLTWSGGDSTQPVSIVLKQGDPNDLKTVTTLTSTATGGTFSWDVPTTIVDASDYAFEIDQTGSPANYSPQFAVAGGSGVSSASGSASASASASASGSSASASASASASESASASASSASASSASASKSKSASASKTSSTAASTSAPSSNSASGLQSPLALLIGGFVAMMYLN